MNYDVARFSGIRNIHGLDIGSIELSSPGLSQVLPRFKELRELKLAMPNIDDRILRSISSIPTLRSLTLQGRWGEQRFDAKGLRHLERLTGLTELELSYLSLDDIELMYVSRIPNLRRLEIGQYSSDDSLKESGIGYLKEATNLVGLRIEVCYRQCSCNLSKIKTLRRLELSDTRVTEEGAAPLQKALPFCEMTWKKP